MKEIWNKIPGFENYYEVSSLGRVRSLTHEVPHKTNKKLTIQGSIKAVHRDRDGYLRTTATNQGHSSDYFVHRLVALAFLPNLDNKPTVNHKNGIKDDNRVENLEWATYQEQSDHAVATGLRTEQTYANRHALKTKLSHPVMCVDTGEIFPSMIQAEQSLRLGNRAVLYSIQKSGPCKAGYTFIKIPKEVNI